MDDQAKLIKKSVIKRTLLGGLLSVLIAGLAIVYITVLYSSTTIPNQVLYFFCFVFLIPSYVVESAFPYITSYPPRIYDFISYTITFIFWFIAGGIIAYFIKRNKVAFGIWFLLYLLMIPIMFTIYFLKNFIFN